MKKKLVYWDSDCFLGLLNKEQDKIKKCQSVIKEAEKGDLMIVTSALTFIEVIKMKGKKSVPKKTEKIIQSFFLNPFISIHNVDREVGIKARDLMWKHQGLRPKDSIHVATAIIQKIPELHTFDEYLLKLSGKVGNQNFRICEPYVFQMEMFD
ncbi:MAG: type II toxin-antitoxin system VapC family toxin [Nitrosopumilus sp.]